MIRDILAIIDGAGNLAETVRPGLALAELHAAALTVHVIDEQKHPVAAFDPLSKFRIDSEAVLGNQRHAAEVEILVAGATVPVTVRGISEEPLVGCEQANAAARAVDLVMIGPGKDWVDGHARSRIVDAILSGSGCPILLHPHAWQPRPFSRVTLGWNDTPEASRAARAALTLAEPMARIDVIMVDAPASGPDPAHDHRAELELHFARHGRTVTMIDFISDGDRTVDLLSDAAMDARADLLAIGAFSHSRLREEIFGGVTESFIAHQRLPVLLVH
jgi:nucleotide-binding universal stress UspA family protein